MRPISMMLAVVLLLAAGGYAKPAGGGAKMERTVPTEPAAMRTALDEWARVLLREESPPPASGPPSVFWSARVTPPVCASWPPGGDGQVIVYAFAAGMRIGLSDGEVVSKPYARFHVDVRTGKATVERLGPLQELGIQGVHPASQADLAAWKQQAACEQHVLDLSRASKAPADAAGVQTFYCMWARNNGVIARDVEGRHPAFFKWLGCKS